MRPRQHRLHLGSRLGTNQVADLLMDLSSCGSLSEEKPDHHHRQQENRSKREDGVEGERRPYAGCDFVANLWPISEKCPETRWRALKR
jgi:hypothetical protein